MQKRNIIYTVTESCSLTYISDFLNFWLKKQNSPPDSKNRDSPSHTGKNREQCTEGLRGCGLVDRFLVLYIWVSEFHSQYHKLGMVMHTCNLSALDVEVGRSGVQVQPWLHSKFEPGWDTWNLSQRETGTQTSRRKDHSIHISIAWVQSSAFSILGTISSLIVEEPSGLNCYREQLDEAAFQRVPGLHHNDKTVQRVLLVGGTG